MVQDHFSFIVFLWYIILCCEKKNPRCRSLDKAGPIKELKDQCHIISINDHSWMMKGWLPMISWYVFRKARERVVGRVKGSESPYVQGTQSSEEDLVIWKITPRGLRGHQSFSLELTGTMCLLFKCGRIVSKIIADKFQSWWTIYVQRGLKINMLHTNKGGFGEDFQCEALRNST